MDHPYLNNVQRLLFMKVPMDVIPDQHLEEIVLDLVNRGQSLKIVFLTYKDFMRARREPEYLGFLNNSALVVPVSKSLEWGCRFLKLPVPQRFYPFDFIIRVLGVLEQKWKSIYLLGGKHKAVQTVAGNIRASFPKLNMVGRHCGYFPKEKEDSIVQAIQKATPSILLIGPGLPGKDKWAFRHAHELPVNISLWSAESFNIMSGNKKRPKKESFRKGTNEWASVLFNPIRWLRGFSYVWYYFLLIYYRFNR